MEPDKQNKIQLKVELQNTKGQYASVRPSGKILRNNIQGNYHCRPQQIFGNNQNIANEQNNEYQKGSKEIEKSKITRSVMKRGKICRNDTVQRSEHLSFLMSEPKVNQSDKTILLSPQSSKSVEEIIEQYKSIKNGVVEKKDIPKGLLLKRGKGKNEFIKRINKQIQFDIRLRNMKHQITSSNKSKLEKIMKEKYCLQLQVLTLCTEEFDPFFVGKQIDNADIFACQLYILHSRALGHWKSQIVKRFDQYFLEQIWKEFESTQDDFISLKVFVKGFNLIFGKDSCLKIRDLHCIFNRIQPLNRQFFFSTLICNRTTNIKRND